MGQNSLAPFIEKRRDGTKCLSIFTKNSTTLPSVLLCFFTAQQHLLLPVNTRVMRYGIRWSFYHHDNIHHHPTKQLMMAFILTNTILMLTDTLLTTHGVLVNKKVTKLMQIKPILSILGTIYCRVYIKEHPVEEVLFLEKSKTLSSFDDSLCLDTQLYLKNGILKVGQSRYLAKNICRKVITHLQNSAVLFRTVLPPFQVFYLTAEADDYHNFLSFFFFSTILFCWLHFC